MSFFLIADEPATGLIPFLQENWLVLIPLVLGFASIYMLLPQARRKKPIWAGVLAAVAVVLGGAILIRTGTSAVESLLFSAFAASAVVGGVMMITQTNPVHAALSFALVVLSTCGLFLLQAAPFLMAATIIIYAGAIVVTFLFVIMLAQQEGVSNADQRSREPFLASLAGCVLLASLVCVLQKSFDTRSLDDAIHDLQKVSEAKDEAEVKRLLGDPTKAKDDARASELVQKLLKQYPDGEISANVMDLNLAWVQMHVEPIKTKAKVVLTALEAKRQQQGTLAVPGKENKSPGRFPSGKLPANNVAALGKTLFTDYLIAVELAATLLLVATIGAIVIAGRRSEELR